MNGGHHMQQGAAGFEAPFILDWLGLVLRDGGELHYPLDEGGGSTALDFAGHNYDGNYIGNPNWDNTDPFSDGCVVLDGNDYIERIASGDSFIPEGGEAFTQEILFRHDNNPMDSPDAIFYIGPTSFATNTNNGVHTLTNGNLRMFSVGSELDSVGAGIAGQQWHILWAEWNGSNLRNMYVDDPTTPIASDARTGINVIRDLIKVGAIRSGSTIPWLGRETKYSIYPGVLTTQQKQDRVNITPGF